MILHSIHISCSTEADPSTPLIYAWNSGDDVFSVECAIAKLQEWVDQHKTPLAIATEEQTKLQ